MRKEDKEDEMSTAVGMGDGRGLARVAIATQRRPELRSSWPDDSRSHTRRSREVGGYMCFSIYICIFLYIYIYIEMDALTMAGQ